MGGHGSGRPQGIKSIVNNQSGRNTSQPAGNSLIIPNHSGDHSRGRVNTTPTTDYEIANKKYVDSVSGGAPEGTAVKSTGEVGGTKFLREDGDGTSSWQPAAAAHTESSTDSLTNKTIDSFTNQNEADEIHIQIRNESGSTMTKGQLVFVSGYNSGLDRPLVTLADASSSSTMPMLAMINDGDITNNTDGHATVEGRVFDINTSAFSAGDAVYVSTTAGALSARPSGTTELVQRIGIVLRSHASNGVIQIIGAGRVNDIPNDMDHATDLQNVGTNTHAQVDTHLALANPHLDWTASTVGTIHATNYVDNDTTDHTALSNIGTNSHAQIDTSVTAQGVNSTHVAGDGSDHADVASNTTHRGDNSQAHSDYLKNDAADVGVGLTLTSDNNTGDTQYTAQVLHGTDASPPTASNFPRGTIYIQYTA